MTIRFCAAFAFFISITSLFSQDRTESIPKDADNLKNSCLTVVGADGNELSVNDIVEYMLGAGISYENVRYQGILGDASVASIGYFSEGKCVPLEFDEGIMLSSGTVGNAVGPNELPYTSSVLGLPGDPDLDNLVPGYNTFDATWIEFDFIPDDSEIFIQYFFGSEEYNQFVGDSYNDVFGLFVNGQNIALIPGTDTPLSINNINNGRAPPGHAANGPCNNCEFFIDNADLSEQMYDIECDGMTTLFIAQAAVNAGETNTIKLAIADTGDAQTDSWVFIKSGSFTTLAPLVPEVQTLNPTEVTPNTSILRGEVIFDGNSDVIDRGFFWSSEEDSVMNDNVVELGPGDEQFEAQLINLEPYTYYYFVAYATNDTGTGYGQVLSFQSLAELPEVMSIDAVDVSPVSAYISGEVTYDGGPGFVDTGFFLSLDPDPIQTGQEVSTGSAAGVFGYQLINLTPNTNYYFVAFAENPAGRAFGDILSFTTLEILSKIPNAFMPSSNILANQVFKPVFNLEPDTYTLKIFNRWGSLIFQSNLPNEGWDGSYDGSDAPTGGYFYSMTYADLEGIQHEHKGIVMLIR